MTSWCRLSPMHRCRVAQILILKRSLALRASSTPYHFPRQQPVRLSSHHQRTLLGDWERTLGEAIALARSNLRRRGGSGGGAPRRRQQAAAGEEPSSSSSSSSGHSSGEESEDERRKREIVEAFKKKYGRWIVLGAGAISGYVLYSMVSGASGGNDSSSMREVSWNDFVSGILPRGTIRKIVIDEELSRAILYPNTHGGSQSAVYVMGIKDAHNFENEVRAAEVALGVPPERWIQVEYQQLAGLRFIVGLAVLAILLLPFILAARKMRSFKMGDMMSSVFKNRVNIIDPHAKGDKLKIKFKDVAGLHEAKMEISEFVDYLKNPAKYTALGARLPKGALLTGPPGTGKTLLAKALAAESSSPFISMNGTEFIEMIGGLGASRIRDLFKTAKSRAPCIIYIDEVDAIGRKRSDNLGNSAGGSGEEEQTLNQLLVEMDGMDTTQGVVVIGSTNRPDILDKALMRPGRFDRHITCDLPTISERKELFDLYLRKVKIENRALQFSQRLAQMTPGFSGADIGNVVNESAIRAATDKRKLITLDDLDYSLQKIIAGPEKRSKVLVKEEREIVAYHESGHALVGWLLEHTDALLKVTIIPRTSAALGFAQYSPKDRKLFNKEELFDRMCMMLGGRAAESVVFNRITTGAQNDLEKVTKQAFAQVKIYGMSELVGPLSFAPNAGDERSSEFMKKPYSRHLHAIMDREVQGLVARAYFATEHLLKENREKLEKLAKALLEREVLNYEDVKTLIGPPTYGDKHVVDLVDQILPEENKDNAA